VRTRQPLYGLTDAAVGPRRKAEGVSVLYLCEQAGVSEILEPAPTHSIAQMALGTAGQS